MEQYSWHSALTPGELLLPSLPPAIANLTRQARPGSRLTHSLAAPPPGPEFYLGLVSYDQAGNQAAVSNLVLVTPNTDTRRPDPTPDSPPWPVVGAGLGGLLLLLLAAVTVATVCRLGRVRPARWSQSKFSRQLEVESRGVLTPSPKPVTDQGQSQGLNHSDCRARSQGPDYSDSRARSQGPDRSDSRARSLGQCNGLARTESYYTNGETPCYWSASQLLGRHEERLQARERVITQV